jgi:hypothetical protein
MGTAKEQLREALDRLTEDEAAEMLARVQEIERRRNHASVFEKLRGDPGFRLPDPDALPFRHFEPITVEGKPLSEMIIEDRR